MTKLLEHSRAELSVCWMLLKNLAHKTVFLIDLTWFELEGSKFKKSKFSNSIFNVKNQLLSILKMNFCQGNCVREPFSLVTKKYLISDIIVLSFVFICCWYRFLSYIEVIFWLHNVKFEFPKFSFSWFHRPIKDCLFFKIENWNVLGY